MSDLISVTWEHAPRIRNLEATAAAPAHVVHGPAVGIFFGFLAIVVGLIFTWIMAKSSFKKYVNLPYTIIMFFFGIILSLSASNATSKDGETVASTEVWMNIDPDLMLYALLPPLLFAEAMQLDSHQVRMAILPSALLALPGAAFGAYMQALVCYYMLPFKWEWLFCFMVGSVLSATDPVSVVNMLKSVRGGSISTTKLTYLITGESLLNDGTALVLFEAIVSKQYDTGFSVVIFFVKVLTISPLVGIGFGLLTLHVLKISRRRTSIEHTVVQIAATVSCAYLSFFVAQYILKCSGIISCCAAGILIAWKGAALILQPEQMEIVWHMLEWVGNTMIFSIAGLIVGKYSHTIEWNDIACIGIIYVTMTLIRALMLAICYPVVKWFHNDYSMKDIAFSTFGGLRGAISLALVLIIEKHLDDFVTSGEVSDHARYFNGDDGRHAMFIICGVVALTIIINGVFAGNFFTWLYNSRLDNTVDEIIFHYVEKRIRRRAREFITNTEMLPPFDAEEVKRLCSVFNYHYSVAATDEEMLDHKLKMDVLTAAASQKAEINFVDDGHGHITMEASEKLIIGGIIDASERNLSSASINSDASMSTVSDLEAGKTVNVQRFNSNSIYKRKSDTYDLNDELIIKFRVVFHGITRHCYMRQIQEGRILRGSGVALALLHASRHGTEMSDTPGMHDFDAILDTLNILELERARLAKFKALFINWPIIFNFFRDWDEQYERDNVFMLTSFLEAHNYAQRIIAKYLGEKGFVDTPEEQLIIRESTIMMREAQKLLDKIDEHVINFHATEMVARMVLNMADDVVTRFQEEGILSEHDSEDFFKKTFHDMKLIGSLHHRDEYIRKIQGNLAAADTAATQDDSERASVSSKKGGRWSWSRRASVVGKNLHLPLDTNDKDNDEPDSPHRTPSTLQGGSQYTGDGRIRLSLHSNVPASTMLSADDDDADASTKLVSVDALEVEITDRKNN